MVYFNHVTMALTDRANELPNGKYIGFASDDLIKEMINWCHENCEGEYVINNYVARFQNDCDYIAWKLRWANV